MSSKPLFQLHEFLRRSFDAFRVLEVQVVEDRLASATFALHRLFDILDACFRFLFVSRREIDLRTLLVQGLRCCEPNAGAAYMDG